MKKMLLSFLAAAIIATGGYFSAFAAETQYTVMTINLRVANESDPYPWSKRKAVVQSFLKERQPDVFGTQEGTFNQLKDVIGSDSDYAWVGEGREGGIKGEFMAIFYKKDRFLPLQVNSFWLSETPDVPNSKSWNTACTRMATVVRFVDTKNGKQFYFVNTHLDHISQAARVNGAKLICSKIKELKSNLPIFITGDFNIADSNKDVHGTFTEAGFFDTWNAPDQKRSELYNTFNDFKMPKKGGEKIDWILTYPELKVISTEIVLPKEGTVFISDHSPVISVVTIP